MKPDMGAIAAWQKKEEEYCRRVDELRVVTEARPDPLNFLPAPARALLRRIRRRAQRSSQRRPSAPRLRRAATP